MFTSNVIDRANQKWVFFLLCLSSIGPVTNLLQLVNSCSPAYLVGFINSVKQKHAINVLFPFHDFW